MRCGMIAALFSRDSASPFLIRDNALQRRNIFLRKN